MLYLNVFEANFKSLGGKLFPIIWLEIVWMSVYEYMCWCVSNGNFFFISNQNRQVNLKKNQLKSKGIWIYLSY